MAKKRGRGSRKQRGGATPYYSFGSAVAPGAPYAAKVEVHDSPNVTRPGFLASAGAGTGGLPGFTGGGRRSKRSGGFNFFKFARNSTRRATKFGRGLFSRGVKMGRNVARRGSKTLKRFLPKQRGGRYTVDVGGAVLGTNVFAPVNRIACEGSTPNPLNPGPHTPSTQPPILRGGSRRSTRKQKGGVWGVDSAAYYAQTAGYGNTPSTWVSSTGTPSMLQTPYAAGAMNPACLKTGGGKRSGKRRGNMRKH
jgi:hypothetical protein